MRDFLCKILGSLHADFCESILFGFALLYRYSCDLRVVRLLRERTLGNTPTKLQKQVSEQHSEVYLQRVLQFLQAREQFHIQASRGMLSLGPPEKPLPKMMPVPNVPWFQAVFLRVMSRLDEMKAKISSTFGSILKMDSTKKVIMNICAQLRSCQVTTQY